MKNETGIIVLGTPRSGTTLLRRLLNAHPQISCPGETFLFRAAAKFLESEKISMGFDFGVLSGMEGLGFSEDDVIARLRDFVSGFYKDIAAREGKPYWAAKTAVDSFYIDEIEQIFSGHAKFICVTRHGLDTVCSMEEFSKDLQTYIAELHAYIAEYPRPLEAFAHAWADVTSDIVEFAARHKDDAITLKYEDLATAPEAALASIQNFLGVEAFPADLSEALGKKAEGVGDWKAHQSSAVESKSVSRWEKQLQPALIEQLAPIVNPVLAQAGYEAVAAGSDEDAKRREELAKMMMQAKEG